MEKPLDYIKGEEDKKNVDKSLSNNHKCDNEDQPNHNNKMPPNNYQENK